MSGALGRRAFSCGPPLLLFGVLLSTYPRVVKVSPLCWLAALRGAGGAFGAEGSWLLRFTQVWLSFVFYRVLVLAVRLEVRVCVALRLQLFLRMRFRLLYLCLCAWPPCCRSTVGVVVFLDLSGSVRARDASVLQGSRSRGTT